MPATKAENISELLSHSEADEEEWDKLWIHYFQHAEEPHLAPQAELQLSTLPDTREEFIDSPLFINCTAEDIIDKAVAEIGCGCGLLAKYIAHFTRYYVGIDWSRLALQVAGRTCPDRCFWLHVTDREKIESLTGEINTVLLRNFMIHQNFEHAQRVLQLCQFLLKPGGKVFADFWLDDPDKPPRRNVFPANTNEHSIPRNSAYRFSAEEIQTLASLCSLKVTDIYDRHDKLRRFVTLTKTGKASNNRRPALSEFVAETEHWRTALLGRIGALEQRLLQVQQEAASNLARVNREAEERIARMRQETGEKIIGLQEQVSQLRDRIGRQQQSLEASRERERELDARKAALEGQVRSLRGRVQELRRALYPHRYLGYVLRAGLRRLGRLFGRGSARD